MQTIVRNIQYTMLCILIVFTSCQDRYNIHVTGKITGESGRPLPNAEVVVLCWYSHDLDDASFIKKTLGTDAEGTYFAKFKKGHQVDVGAKAIGYQPNRSYNELSERHVKVNFELAPEVNNPSLATRLLTDVYWDSDSDSVPLIETRLHVDPITNKFDLNNIETYGFDLKTLTISKDTTQCDFWFKIERQEGQPEIIHANVNGGIIAAYIGAITTFLFEKPIAPTTGYTTSHRLKGNEEGFFVLCRDGRTFGKIIFDKSEIDAGRSDDKGGYYTEYIKLFSCLYQPDGTTNLSYSRPDIDLESFLVDHRFQ